MSDPRLVSVGRSKITVASFSGTIKTKGRSKTVKPEVKLNYGGYSKK